MFPGRTARHGHRMSVIHCDLVTHPRLARLAGLVAVAALARALALTTGLFDPGPLITGRLPFESPTLGGLALALIVAAPMAATAMWAGAGHPHAGGSAMFAGILLVCWIGVQLMVIRTFTWIQPAMVVVGLAVFAAGWSLLDRSWTRAQPEHLVQDRSPWDPGPSDRNDGGPRGRKL
jgi:hypothetical protein